MTFHASLPFIKRVDIPFVTHDLLAVAYEALPDLVSVPTFRILSYSSPPLSQFAHVLCTSFQFFNLPTSPPALSSASGPLHMLLSLPGMFLLKSLLNGYFLLEIQISGKSFLV